MGKRGPAPKPTSLKVLHGADERRVNRNEPKPAPGKVAPPSWLAAAARRVWRQYAPDLVRTGVLTAWDCETFGCWCDAAVRRREAAAQVAELGAVVEQPILDRDGRPSGNHRLVKNPWLAALNDADAQLQRYGARFGLTPSDRAQLSVGEARRDPGEDLLSG